MSFNHLHYWIHASLRVFLLSRLEPATCHPCKEGNRWNSWNHWTALLPQRSILITTRSMLSSILMTKCINQRSKKTTISSIAVDSRVTYSFSLYPIVIPASICVCFDKKQSNSTSLSRIFRENSCCTAEPGLLGVEIHTANFNSLQMIAFHTTASHFFSV